MNKKFYHSKKTVFKKVYHHNQSNIPVQNYNFTMSPNELFFFYSGKRQLPAFPHIPDTVKVLYITILSLDTANNSFIFHDLKTLANIQGISISTLNRRLRALEDWNLIDILTAKIQGQGARTKNIIVIRQIDKQRTLDLLLLHENKQPKSLKPITHSPNYSIENLSRKLHKITGLKFEIIGLKKNLSDKNFKRNEKGQFLGSIPIGQNKPIAAANYDDSQRSDLPSNNTINTINTILEKRKINNILYTFHEDKTVSYQGKRKSIFSLIGDSLLKTHPLTDAIKIVYGIS